MEDEALYIIPVSRETYREIRQLLIEAGQGGIFERHPVSGEMINLTGIAIWPGRGKD